MSSYTNKSQQRLLKVIIVLFSDVVRGVSAHQIRKETGCSAAAAHRDLCNLQEAGWAVQDETSGTWRIAPRIGQQAIKIFNAIERSQRMVDEARRRYTNTNPD